MGKAQRLEELHERFDELKGQEAEAKGGIKTIMKQLDKYGIGSIESAKAFIRNRKDKKNKASKELDILMDRIEKLLDK